MNGFTTREPVSTEYVAAIEKHERRLDRFHSLPLLENGQCSKGSIYVVMLTSRDSPEFLASHYSPLDMPEAKSPLLGLNAADNRAREDEPTFPYNMGQRRSTSFL